ncbi:MAG: type IV pilus modification PilV family protein [Candidatus Rifleibacteriota bacterium]
MYIRTRGGVTLLEIVSALLILAFAFLPIFGMITSGSKDTDISETYIFAQTSARNILDSLLDDVPFYALRVATSNVSDIGESNSEPNVGELFDIAPPLGPNYQVASFLRSIGNDPEVDHFTRGELTDDRGNKYKLKIYVFPVPCNDPFDNDTDMSFRYLPRPEFEKQLGWYTVKPQESDAYVVSGDNPYNMALPAIEIKDARSLGAQEGPAGNNFCVMKKILLRIKWTLKNGIERSIEVYTMKANLDREGS